MTTQMQVVGLSTSYAAEEYAMRTVLVAFTFAAAAGALIALCVCTLLAVCGRSCRSRCRRFRAPSDAALYRPPTLV